MLVALSAALILLALPSAAQAVPTCDTSWLGGDGSWSDSSKWSNGVPDFTMNTCVTAAGDYTVTVTANTASRTIQVGAGGGTQRILVTSSAGQEVKLDGGRNDEASVINAGGVVALAGSGKSVLDGDNSNHPLVNHGTIRSETSALDPQIHGAVENAADGTMVFDGGVCVCTGRRFVNRGTLTVPANRTFGARIGGQGVVIEQAGGTWRNDGFTRIVGGKYTHSGGNLTGNPTEICDASIDPSGTGTATYLVRRDTTAGCGATIGLSGPVGAGITLRLRNEGESTLDATVPGGGLTIHGTVIMEGGTSGPGDNRVLIAGVVTVAPGGTLRSVGLGQRIVQNTFTNSGMLLLDRELYFDKSFTQTASGTLHSIVAGTNPAVNRGQLIGQNDVVLAGTLRTTTTITPAGSFDVVRSIVGTRTGTFSTTQASGPAWDVSYEPAAVRLSPPAPGNPPGGDPPGGDPPGGDPPVDVPPPPPPPPPPATSYDLRGNWILTTTTRTGARYVLHENYSEMDQRSGRYAGRGQGGQYTWNTEGAASGNRVHFVTGPYHQLTPYVATFDGVILDDGSITGTWTDTNGNSGTFTQVRTEMDPPLRGPHPPANAFLGNWALDTFDASGRVRYSRSAVTFNGQRGGPHTIVLGHGSNPPHTFSAEINAGADEVRMTLNSFNGLGVPNYAMRHVGERINENTIVGTWTDGEEEGQWRMTRSDRPASTSGSLRPSLRPSARASAGGGVVDVTAPTSCNLSASSAGVYAASGTRAAGGRKRRRLRGIRVARFGPTFVSAGEKIRIPVQAVPRVVKRRARVRVAATDRTVVDMRVTCSPSSGPGSSGAPPATQNTPINTTVAVPTNVTTQTSPEQRRLKPGLWVGTPTGGGAGGVSFSVAGNGAIIDPAAQPLVVRAAQSCGSPQGPTPGGIGKVTLTRPLSVDPANSYPRTARYSKTNISASGGSGGYVLVSLSFNSDSTGTLAVYAGQPVRPLGFGCAIPTQVFTLRHQGSGDPPAPRGGDGVPYETGEGATTQGPQRATTTTVVCNRGAQPTSDSNCIATVIDSGDGVRLLPTGLVRWSAERGSFPNGNTCEVRQRPSSPSMAECTIVYRPDAAGTPAGTRIPVSAEYQGSLLHSRSSGAAQGTDPLVAVCSGLWTPGCEGRLPRPEPVETCVAAWQRCEGFGGSTGGGTIDTSGLPTTVEAPVSCGPDDQPKRVSGAGVSDETQCIINTSVNGCGCDADAAAADVAFRNNLRAVRLEVDTRRTKTSAGLLSTMAQALGANAADQHTTRVVSGFTLAVSELVDGAYDRFKQPGGPRGWPRSYINAEVYCERNFSHDAGARSTCVSLLERVNTELYNDAAAILALQRRLGVDTPLSSQRKPVFRVSAAGRRRAPFVFATGRTTVGVGENGELKLRFSPEARGLLRGLRRRGVKSITATAEVTTFRAGIRSRSTHRIRLRLR